MLSCNKASNCVWFRDYCYVVRILSSYLDETSLWSPLWCFLMLWYQPVSSWCRESRGSYRSSAGCQDSLSCVRSFFVGSFTFSRSMLKGAWKAQTHEDFLENDHLPSIIYVPTILTYITEFVMFMWILGTQKTCRVKAKVKKNLLKH